MAHRNRWFTVYLLKMGHFPWQTVSHNQMVPFNMASSRGEHDEQPVDLVAPGSGRAGKTTSGLLVGGFSPPWFITIVINITYNHLLSELAMVIDHLLTQLLLLGGFSPTPLKNDGVSSSIGIMKFPINMEKTSKCSKPPMNLGLVFWILGFWFHAIQERSILSNRSCSERCFKLPSNHRKTPHSLPKELLVSFRVIWVEVIKTGRWWLRELYQQHPTTTLLTNRYHI